MRAYACAMIATAGCATAHAFTTADRADVAYDHYVARYGNDRASMGTLAFEVISIDAVGADGAIVLGRWKLTDTPAAGDGVFTVVLARRPEGWRIVHDHTSSTPPPTPAPAPAP